jgi:hypothetical protein
MGYIDRFRSMNKEQIKLEKEHAIHIMGLLHDIRLKALTHNLKNPTNQVKVPDDSYMILNWMVQAVPDDMPMPHSLEEMEEYTLFKKHGTK